MKDLSKEITEKQKQIIFSILMEKYKRSKIEKTRKSRKTWKFEPPLWKMLNFLGSEIFSVYR